MPLCIESKERDMADNKNPNQKQPGEKEPGKYHYNPGNQSGKTIEPSKSDEQVNDVDRTQNPRQQKS
jgi:hypothetical protein